MPLTVEHSVFSQYSRLHIGFSGGLDSSVLLHYLAKQETLKDKLHVIHINHQLHADAAKWQSQCANICKTLDVPYSEHSVTLPKKGNIEEQARSARLAFFKQQVMPSEALVLAHHQNDQAETLLLQLFRGAGIDGLGAIKETSQQENMTIIRPFLSIPKIELEAYAKQHQLTWVDDDSNRDITYRRNFVRHKVLPQLLKPYPAIIDVLARNARVLKEQSWNLQYLLDPIADKAINDKTLDINQLYQHPASIQSSIFQLWLKRLKIRPCSYQLTQRVFKEVIEAGQDKTPYLTHGDYVITRYRKKLYVIKEAHYFNEKTPNITWQDPINPLILKTIDCKIEIKTIHPSLAVSLFDQQLDIKWRKGGETLLVNGYHKSLKKLLQESNIPPWQRKRLPLLYINDELSMIIGVKASDKYNEIYGANYHIELISC